MKTHSFNDQHEIVRSRNIPVAVKDGDEGVIILFSPPPAHDSCDGTAMMAMDCLDCVFESHLVCTACLSYHEDAGIPTNYHAAFIAWAISAMRDFDNLDHPWFEVDVTSNPLEEGNSNA